MKVVLIVQARMNSVRLPGKVLLQASGKPMLAHLIDRLRKVRNADELVIATSIDPRDDVIVAFCDSHRLSVFRGEELDVLARYKGAADQFQADVIVRLTADCPLIDPAVIEQVIACYLENPESRLYVSNTLERTFPRGMDTEVFSRTLLNEADRQATSKQDREHVSPYMIRNDYSDITQRNIECWKNLSVYRFTLDYPKDYAQISGLLDSNLPDFSLSALMNRAIELNLAHHDSNNDSGVQLTDATQGTLMSDYLMSRFGLGTAQFGMYYGRFNHDGVPSKQVVCNILEKAASRGFSVIDTAHLYGESEAVLGHCPAALRAFSIITKTPSFSGDKIRREDAQLLRDAFQNSLNLMGQPAIEGLLAHHAPNLLAEGGERLYQAMLRLKEDGLVKHIGVSAYSGEIVEQIHEQFPLDFVQLPINLFDRRLSESGSLARIVKAGIKIHARSAFLQGLLLVDADTLPSRFQSAQGILKSFQLACKSSGFHPAHAALHYLLGIAEIDKIIIGIESLNQFADIFSDFPEKIEMNYAEFRIDDVKILNPVQWVN